MSKVAIDFEMPDLEEKLRQAEHEIHVFVAAQAQFNRGMLFDQEGGYNGHEKWAPLQFRTGQILSKRGTLRKSIAPMAADGRAGPDGIVRFSGDVVTIGTRLIYARMMNDGTTKLPGGVLRPRNAKALKIPLPPGKTSTEGAKSLRSGAKGKGDDKFIFRKSVKIPARPFDEWNTEDEEEMSAALANKLAEILNRG